MYKVTLEQKGYNKIVLEYQNRSDVVKCMFNLVGHMREGSVKLEETEEQEGKVPQTGGNQ